MKISIIRRIEALEQRTKKNAEPPSLIMIHYDESVNAWKVVEHYASVFQKGIDGYKSKTHTVDKLQDFCFAEDFDGRVILNTFGNPDQMICENLFVFDIDDLRKELTCKDRGAVYIQSILPSDEKGTTVEIVALTKCK